MASKVKILGKDVVASYKVMLAVVILPISVFIVTLLFNFIGIPLFLPSLLPIRYSISILFCILYPIYNYFMIKCTGRFLMHYKNFKAKMTILFNKQQYKNLVSIR